ncbi:MAG: RHS repeat protein [Aeromicrobium sp.]|nr:RHS repeat protein [Burkholderiales bacterium]
MNSAFAYTYVSSPSLGTWSVGSNIQVRAESTNSSNPINNQEVSFVVSKTVGSFTSPGLMCLCLKNGAGTCTSIDPPLQYYANETLLPMPPLTLTFSSNRTYFVQKSSNGLNCNALDNAFKSGEITVSSVAAPPIVRGLSGSQSGRGLIGSVQVTNSDGFLLASKVHVARDSTASTAYNCITYLASSTQQPQPWEISLTTGADVDAAAGRTCASVFGGTGAHTLYVKIEASNTLGKTAPVGVAGNPIAVTVDLSPRLDSVDPLTAPINTPATVTAYGANFPSTIVMDIAGQAPGCTRQSATETQATFSCPLSAAGSRILSVKTNTVANGGTLIGTTKTFVVTSSSSTNITGITPDNARLDRPTQFTVTGTGLTSGMGFAVDDCELVTEVAGGTSVSRAWTCIPRAPGIKTARIKTAPGGTELRAEQVRVEHPQRMGDAASRGNPTVGGVSLFNGNLFMQSVDLAVPGKGLSFALSRSYNSYDWQYETDHGGVPANRPWRFNIEMKIGYVPNSGNKRLYIAREDGSGESYFLSVGTWYPIDLGNFSTIKLNVDGTYTVQTRGQLSHTFDPPSGTGRLLRTSDRDGNQITYAYGGNGKVSQITDSSGRAYSVTYDPQVRVSRVTDFTGRYVEYTYTDTTNGRISTFRDVRGGITTYGYNGNGDLTTVTDPNTNPALTVSYVTVYGNKGVKSLTTAVGRATGGRTCNGSTVFTYCFTYTQLAGSAGFTTVVDGPENANTLTVTFDNAGRASAITDGKGNTRTTVFADISDSASYAKNALATARKSALGVANGYQTDIGLNLTHGLVESVKNAESETSATSWGLSPTSNLFTPNTVTSPLSNTSGLGFTTSGRPNRITAAAQYAVAGSAGASTTLGWTNGQLSDIINPVGNSISLGRDANGNLTTTTDPRNLSWITTRAYDTLGRVITITDARGGVNRFTYDLAGNLKTSTQELPAPATNIVNSYDYDANGNTTRHTDGRGVITDYTYDIGNRLTTISRVVSGVTTTRTLGYDNASRLISVTNENNNTSTRVFDGAGRVTSEALPLSRTTVYVYDADNRLSTVTDPENRTVTYTYDRVGRVKSVTNALDLTQRYEYDPDGRLSALRDANGNITRYGYDRNGNLTTVTDANNVTSSAEYDNANRMVSRTDPRGKTTRYTYDAAGNMSSEKDPIGNTWTYTYDQNSNLTGVLNPDGRSVTHTYDAANRRSRTTYSNATQVNYIYDANGNLLSMADNMSGGTSTTTYVYDEANRLKQFTDPFGNVVNYTFDKAGNRKTITYPGSRTVTYGYDIAERMTSVLDWTPRIATYAYNKADQITRLTHGNGTYADYTYDTAGRLTSLINKQSNGTVISSHIHTLDAFGNVTQAVEILPLQPTLTPHIKRWTVDEANRALTDSVSGDSFEHDAAGRLIRQIISSATTNFAYNDLDLLTTLTSPGRTESYRYNGQGHRLERIVNGAATRFLIEPNGAMPNLLAETNASNSPLRFYVYGANGLLSQIDAVGAYHAYHFTPIGHTSALTDASGVLTDSYGTLPFGGTTTGPTNVTTNPFRFVGRLGVYDDENGNIYARARYQSQYTNRFISLDGARGDLTSGGSLNRFAYAAANPLTRIDPTGLFSVSEWWSDWKSGAHDMLRDGRQYSQDIYKNLEAGGELAFQIFHKGGDGMFSESSAKALDEYLSGWAKIGAITNPGTYIKKFVNEVTEIQIVNGDVSKESGEARAACLNANVDVLFTVKAAGETMQNFRDNIKPFLTSKAGEQVAVGWNTLKMKAAKLWRARSVSDALGAYSEAKDAIDYTAFSTQLDVLTASFGATKAAIDGRTKKAILDVRDSVKAYLSNCASVLGY